ncbi:MAG: DUF3021 domain-containing protein [Johnsonella sp.]|nr:DUF3021 domain-containing protein [Johnsonella sp.]
MFNMMKNMIKSSFIGVAISILIFCVVGLVIDITNKGIFSLANYQFTKMVLGAIGVGLGFGLPSFIYENDRIPYPLQIVFHMGIGCAVMLIIGFAAGWIPTTAGFAPVIATVAGEILVAFIIWKCLSVHYKKEAEKINEQLNLLNK